MPAVSVQRWDGGAEEHSENGDQWAELPFTKQETRLGLFPFLFSQGWKVGEGSAQKDRQDMIQHSVLLRMLEAGINWNTAVFIYRLTVH